MIGVSNGDNPDSKDELGALSPYQQTLTDSIIKVRLFPDTQAYVLEH
jgi:hypothetical protein